MNTLFEMRPLEKGLFMPQFSNDITVRALSWYQPYASLMLHGKQETRRYDTKVRGWVLICSCAKWWPSEIVNDISGLEQCARITEVIKAYPQHFLYGLTSKAIAIGYLYGARKMREDTDDENETFVAWRPNMWIWEFSNVHPINPFAW